MAYDHYSKPLMSLQRKGAHAKSHSTHCSALLLSEVQVHHQILDNAATHAYNMSVNTNKQ